MTALASNEFKLWADYIHSICGVFLDESKAYLIETRLSGLMRETASATFVELHGKVERDTSNGLKRKVIEAITTNETSFFRDTSPFELLQNKILPDLIDKRTKLMGAARPIPIRIWSAACSTGQEVYSMCMVLRELLPSTAHYDIRILGTDISDRAVAHASRGIYTKLELDRGLSSDKIAKHFTVSNDTWKVKDEIRAMATFKTMNLLEPFSFPARFDIILCRNVAIYFTEENRTKLFRGIGRALAPDGYLLIGSTESITGLCPEFVPMRYLRSVFYQFKNADGQNGSTTPRLQ